MATGTLEESVQFAAKLIKKNPDISMTELKKAAKPKGIRIYPLAIGKAKVSLGMGKKRASRKKTKRKTTRKKTAARRGPGRPKGSKTRSRGSARLRRSTPSSFRQEAADKLRTVASKAILGGDDKTASKLLEMIKELR
jgi:hypothetical protein